MDWCGLFGLRGGAPRRAKRGGSQWEACFEGSSDAVGDEGSQVEERAEGVGVSVEGPGGRSRAMAPRASVAYVAARMWSPDGLYRGGDANALCRLHMGGRGSRLPD